ncbi:MAG: orotidine-5'-phosphate decarboxylase [Candidatus Paceibacterota bacterium]|jgi:orotidine-5'-phosphate decarboxylase
MIKFFKMLERQWELDNFVCVGLDSDPAKIPKCVEGESTKDRIIAFNRAIVEATSDCVCAYKPNMAFYEAHVLNGGMEALYQTILDIKSIAPGVPVILDGKRADIDNTNIGYVQELNSLGADAITVNPYLGGEALQPFLDLDKGIIVLCRTSNKGSGEFQNLIVNGEPLYCYVARQVSGVWNKKGNCAVVVGATCPEEELRKVREIIGDMPILIPGIGAQGGDLEKTVIAGQDSWGGGMVINSSRGIIFASNKEDFAEAACRETLKLRDSINSYL